MTKIALDGIVFEQQAVGGISRIYQEILPRLCDLDQSLVVSLLTGGPLAQTLPRHPRITHETLAYWQQHLRPGRYFARARWHGRSRALAAWLDKQREDLFHSTNYTLPNGWRGPVVITAYDLIYKRFPQLFATPEAERTRVQIEQAVLDADLVICISASTRADLLDYYNLDPAKLRVIPLGVSPVFSKMAAGPLPGAGERPFLLYVGRRGKHKNFATLLAAYARWDGRQADDLLVAGDPWTAEEMRRLNDLGVTGKVRLKTAVSDQELALLYNQAAAFVYPSLYEGFGLPLLEAMACGCPVVASRIPTSLEVGAAVPYYFAPESGDDLLLALDAALRGGRSAAPITEGIRQAAAYSWENSARQTLEVYRALI